MGLVKSVTNNTTLHVHIKTLLVHYFDVIARLRREIAKCDEEQEAGNGKMKNGNKTELEP